MKKPLIHTILFVLFLIILLPVGKIFAEPISITVMAPAHAMVVLEGNTNCVLNEFNKDKKLAQASTTKITTAIVAIENCLDLDENFVVSDNAVGIEGTSIYLNKGEVISIKELLYGLMLASGNDCAVAIAERLGGYVSFVNLMNEFVQNIGAKNTHYDNPHGLDSDTHYTTAYDLALITSYALKNPIFREICGTKYHTIPATNNHDARYLKHKNKLLFSNEECIGVKTGFTDNAGRCLVNAFEKDGMQIISVVLNCGPMFEEALRLTNNAYNEYVMKEFVKPYTIVSDVNVINGDTNKISVATIKGFKIPVKITEIDNYHVCYDVPNDIVAPVSADVPIGTVRVTHNDNIIFEEPLYATSSSSNVNLKYMLDGIFEKWFIN